MSKSKDAFDFTAGKLVEGRSRLYLWTFTFAEVLPIKETRKRWNHLLTLIRRRWPRMCGLRVFELHPGGHGLHVHMITIRFIDVNECRIMAKRAGWGRIHVERIPAGQVGYVAKYLDKERPPCFKRWRLWAAVGTEWTPTRVKDVERISMATKVYAACRAALGWEGRKWFRERMEMVRRLVNLTIEGGWEAGLGPRGKGYGSFLCFVVTWWIPEPWARALGRA